MSLFRLALLAATVSALTVLGSAQPAAAAVEVPFAPRFSSSGLGDVAIAANTLMTCPDAGGTEANCLAARAGTASGAALNNNGYTMERVDVDGDPTTFDSSRATLALPPGATVRFAGLYFGARTSAGSGGSAAPAAAARGTVLFQPPGAAGYSALTASVNDSTGIAGAFTGFVDVTAAVAAAGPGEYGVANVQAGSGVDRYGGWSLVVAYSDPTAPPRSIRIYDGLATITQNEAPLQIAVGGLETPPSETVNARVGIVGYEGDRGASGDRLSLDGQFLTDAANPVNNVFNSSIALEGADVAGRAPAYINQLGFDADILNADGILANGATAATLEESTTLEQYLTQAVVVSVELDPAALEPAEPPATIPAPLGPPAPTSAPAPPADHGGSGSGRPGKGVPEARLELEVEAPAQARPSAVVAYRVTVENAGGAPAQDVEVCNRLPASLPRLTAPRAQVRGASACWRLAKLPAHGSHTFTTTARVDAARRRELKSTTVLRSGDAATRRSSDTLLVAPLPLAPCARAARLSRDPVAQASC